MPYYTFTGTPDPTVRWVYGLEIDHSIIERIDTSLSSGLFPSHTLSSSPFSDDGMFADDIPMGANPLDEQMARVNEFLRGEYGVIGAMGAWDPDPVSLGFGTGIETKEGKMEMEMEMERRSVVIIAVHAHGTPKGVRGKREILERVERVRREVVFDAKRRAKWYHSSEAGVWKRDVKWEERPRQFIRFH